MKTRSNTINGLVVGVMLGLLMSVIPWECSFPLGIVLLVLWVVRRVGGSVGREIGSDLVSGAAACAVIVVAIMLPVKQLDEKVGPLRYGEMTLDDLCQSLHRDHHLLVFPDDECRTNLITSFRTAGPMSRRELLKKLANDTQCELRIRYCASGATFLFGSYPCPRLCIRAAAGSPQPAQDGSPGPTSTQVPSTTNQRP